MSPKHIFTRAVTLADDSVMQIKATQLGNKIAATEWNLKELLNHMVYELSWVPELLAGKSSKELRALDNGDLLGDDIQATWTDAADQARRAVELASEDTTVHLVGGSKSAADYLIEMGVELLKHGWDVSRAMSCSLVFDPAVSQAVYDVTLPRQEAFLSSGTLSEPLEVPDDAPIQVRLLGLMGRRTEVEDA